MLCTTCHHCEATLISYKDMPVLHFCPSAKVYFVITEEGQKLAPHAVPCVIEDTK